MVGFEEDSKASAKGVSVGNQLVAVNGDSVVRTLHFLLFEFMSKSLVFC